MLVNIKKRSYKSHSGNIGERGVRYALQKGVMGTVAKCRRTSLCKSADITEVQLNIPCGMSGTSFSRELDTIILCKISRF